MIMGFDMKPHRHKFFYVDNTGMRIAGDYFLLALVAPLLSESLDTQENRYDMSADEAVCPRIKAIRHATFRDAYSGGFIQCLSHHRTDERVYGGFGIGSGSQAKRNNDLVNS
jgi:20S proteasome subunit beta 5